jgi:Tfp pilus assembly protein PilZ
MRERRKHVRKSLMAYTQVFDLYGGFLLGYLGDLTLQGAMVISERQHKKGTEVTLAFELPELPNTRASRMTLPARVVWCEQDLSPQFFNVGFEFREVNEAQKILIEAIIREYEFRRDVPGYPVRPEHKK